MRRGPTSLARVTQHGAAWRTWRGAAHLAGVAQLGFCCQDASGRVRLRLLREHLVKIVVVHVSVVHVSVRHHSNLPYRSASTSYPRQRGKAGAGAA